MKKVLLILVMVIIFQLSNTPHLYVSNPMTWFNTPQYEENLDVQTFFSKDGMFFYPYQDIFHKEFILHKISHIVIFSILTILAYFNFKRKPIRAWLFVTIYACLDEIHQAFIVGRSGRAMDIVLDSAASFITIMVIFLIFIMKKNRSK